VRFSIVLPTYNVGEYIERCLLSCIHQTYHDIEVVVVDDCGHDDSIERARRVAEKDSRIKIVRNLTNLGTYHARRIGVENSTGEYILFLDPDDELRINTVEVVKQSLKIKKDILLYGVENIPRKKFYETQAVMPQITGDSLDRNNVRKIFMARGFNLGTAGKVFRREILMRAYSNLSISPSTRLIFSEDVLLFSEALSLSESASVVSENLYVYHRNQDSVTQVQTTEALRFKAAQATFCLCLISKRAEVFKDRCYIYGPVFQRLEVDAKKLNILLNVSFLSGLKDYVFIIRRAKSIKYVVKMFVYIVTGMKVRLV